MTLARCGGRGGGRLSRWLNCTLKWVTILSRGDTVSLPGRCKRIEYQPGFHGIRTQSAELLASAIGRGYNGELPMLFYVQKITHGKPLLIV